VSAADVLGGELIPAAKLTSACAPPRGARTSYAPGPGRKLRAASRLLLAPRGAALKTAAGARSKRVEASSRGWYTAPGERSASASPARIAEGKKAPWRRPKSVRA